MSWKFKEERCECGANLKDIEPINVQEGETPTAMCPSCWQTHGVVEVEPEAQPEPEPSAEEAPAEEETPTEEPGPEVEPGEEEKGGV